MTTPAAPLSTDATLPAPPAATPVARAALPAWLFAALLVLFVLGLLGAGLAWRAEQRLASAEQELVRRQEESAAQSAEARLLAKQAQDHLLETAAKVALLEARLAEVAVQRGQLEELIQSLSRSRDENLLVDVDAGLRVALQQSAITGSAEPVVAALKAADERLARYNQPRLEGVRRAIASDLDRAKASSTIDTATLTIRLDEAMRLIDELPVLASADSARKQPPRSAGPAAAASAATAAALSASRPAPAPGWRETVDDWTRRALAEARALVRVSRIDDPNAMLLAPEQAFFLKENLKLRLLNARIALLARQYSTVQTDLAVVQSWLERYFDRGAKRTNTAYELVKQVATQSRQVALPRPDETFAAITAAAAGR